MPKAGTVGCWLELPLSTDRFATEDQCSKAKARSPQVASRPRSDSPLRRAERCDRYILGTAYRRSGLIGPTRQASTHALPGSCSTWPRALAMAAPTKDAAESGAGAPVPAAGSKWPPSTAAFAHVTVTLATVMREPFALADTLLLATRTWQPSLLTAQAPARVPGVSVILRNHAWPSPIDALSWGSETPAGLLVVGRRLLFGSQIRRICRSRFPSRCK